MIDVERLIAAGIAQREAEVFLPPLLDAFTRYRVNSPIRQAAFIGQAAHESRAFTQLEEDLDYRSAERVVAVFGRRVGVLADAGALLRRPVALANRVYAWRNGNGDESSGDGWRFRGRGLFQLTGRYNYSAAGNAIGRPYEEQPDLVALPAEACRTAAWFWATIRGNEMADAGNVDGITRAINGSKMEGAAKRRERYEQALQAFI